MKIFTAIPFVRIVLPFLAGIPAGLFLKATYPLWAIVALISLVAAGSAGYFKRSFFRQALFFGGADLFLFSCAVLLIVHCDLRTRDQYFARDYGPGEKITLAVYPSDLPVKKAKWRKCELAVTHVLKGNELQPAEGRLIGYFSYGIDSSFFAPGQPLLISAKLVEAIPPMNPHEFDYANWLSNRQVFHTVFVAGEEVSRLGISPSINRLWAFGLKCRSWLLNTLAASGLTQKAYAICSALLTGQDDDIDRDTMSAFAHSGTLHVLSVSGLHTGLVYLALDFIISLIAGKKRHKLVRFLVITAGLWLFALMTGFAAPVLRAVIMFNLMGLGNIYFRNHPGNQLNILFLSAFVLLSWNPYFLFELGFMLSYLAMIGLICFTPPLMALWIPRGAFAVTLWKSVCASFAATISTLPVTLFFFKQFPLWFFVCNLVVVPASSLLLLFSVLLLFKIPLLAAATNWLVNALVVFIQWFNTPGLGYIDNLDFKMPDLLFCSVFMVLLSLALHGRSFRLCMASMYCLIAWQCYSLGDSFFSKSASKVTVYHLKKQHAVGVKAGPFTRLDLNDSSQFDFHVKPDLISYNYPTIERGSFNFAGDPGSGVLLLHGNRAPLDYPPQTTTLVLEYNATMPAIEKVPNLKLVICDGSNSAQAVSEAAILCRKFGIGFYSTAAEGAAELVLK